MKIYNGRSTAKQWTKRDKNAVQWTKLSRRTFQDNQTRLQRFTLAYHLANFPRRWALPREIGDWWRSTVREILVEIGARVVRHAKYGTFEPAEVASREEFSPRSWSGSRG